MPHTNRKKKGTKPAPSKPAIVHTKRQEVQDDDGWTHIVDKPRTRRTTVSDASKGLHAGDFEINGVGYVNRSLEEMKVDCAYWKKSWEESEACAGLKRSLDTTKEETEGTEAGEKAQRLERRRVDNVIVLGLGSLQSARREGRRASATQLAALQTIVSILGNEMQVILQDPQFTSLDTEFLTSLGYQVVEDPAAFSQITEGSLVYAIHCYAKVYKAVSEAARPALLIGTDVENFGRFNLSETADAAQKGLEDMVKDCETIDFPQVRHDFSDTKIYWRVAQASEAVESDKAVETPAHVESALAGESAQEKKATESAEPGAVIPTATIPPETLTSTEGIAEADKTTES